MLKKYSASTIAIESLIRFRWLCLFLILGASAYFAWQLRTIVLDGSVERVLIKNDPERTFNARAMQMFGSDEVIAVAVRYPDGVWREGALRQLQGLTEQFECLDHVTEVYSLSNQPLITSRFLAVNTDTIMRRLDNGEPLEELRHKASQDPMVRGNLLATDGRTAGIYIRLAPIEDAPNAKQALTAVIRKILDKQVGRDRYHLTGWPVVQAEIGNYLLRDLIRLVPLAALVISVLLWFSFRRAAGVILPLCATGLALLWTMGALAASGRSVSMITNSLPVMMIAIGTTYCIHVLAHLFRKLDETGDQLAAIRSTLRSTGPSVLFCGFTTMIGFGALNLSAVEAIAEFGTFAVWGVAAGMLMALVLIPVLVTLVPLRRKQAAAIVQSTWPAAFVSNVFARRRLVWLMTGLIVAMSVIGISQIRVETAPVSWFPPRSDVRSSVDFVNQHFGGITMYNVVIETDQHGSFYEPVMLKKLESFQQWLQQQPEVRSTLSIADPIKTTVAAFGVGPQIPPGREMVQTMLTMAKSQQIRGLRTLLTEDGRAANVMIRSPIISSEEGVAFAARVDRVAAEHFGKAARAKITGSAHLAFRTNIQFTRGLITSLSISMAAIFVTMVIAFRSWKLGLLGMVPNIIPIGINYAILGLGDLTLNAGTSITGCIAIGMAVDDAIHFLMAYLEGLKRGENRQAALEFAVERVGQPIFNTSVALLSGFSILMMSSLMPISSLGLLVAVTMVACLVCDMVLLPVLLTTKLPRLRRLPPLVTAASPAILLAGEHFSETTLGSGHSELNRNRWKAG